jgi:hypothetical protein
MIPDASETRARFPCQDSLAMPEIARELRHRIQTRSLRRWQRLGSVMSSIMHRRSGLISVIIISCLKVGQTTQSFKTEIMQIPRSKCRASGFVQSDASKYLPLCRFL